MVYELSHYSSINTLALDRVIARHRPCYGDSVLSPPKEALVIANGKNHGKNTKKINLILGVKLEYFDE